jgi:hypothetical protein
MDEPSKGNLEEIGGQTWPVRTDPGWPRNGTNIWQKAKLLSPS